MIDPNTRTDNSHPEKVLLKYEGPLHEEAVNDLLVKAEDCIQQLEIDRSTRKKVFGVFLESLQNAHKHADDQSNVRPSTILLTLREEHFYLVICNVLNQASRDDLEKKLLNINALSKDSIQDKYREILANGVQSEIGGSGLGLLDIARRSGNKLEYHFNQIEPEVFRFTLKVKV